MSTPTPRKTVYGVSRECCRDDHSYCWRHMGFGGLLLECDCFCHQDARLRRAAEMER